jgi:hypothetical protein
MSYSRLLLPALAAQTAAAQDQKKLLPVKTIKYHDLPVKVSGRIHTGAYWRRRRRHVERPGAGYSLTHG